VRKKSSKRPSVRLSVRPSHCAALLKRCMLRSQNLYCVMPHELYYSGKISRRWVMGGSICRTKAWKRDTPKMFSSEKWSLYRYWLVAWKREKRPDANSLKNFERNKDPHNVIIKKRKTEVFPAQKATGSTGFFCAQLQVERTPTREWWRRSPRSSLTADDPRMTSTADDNRVPRTTDSLRLVMIPPQTWVHRHAT